MHHVVTAMLLVVAVIHLLPLTGLLGAEQLGRLYGLSITEPNLSILMLHRAVLFGLLGALLAIAAFVPSLQPIAFIAGAISVGSFLVIAWLIGGYNTQIGRVVKADLLAAVCLAVGYAAHWYACSTR